MSEVKRPQGWYIAQTEVTPGLYTHAEMIPDIHGGWYSSEDADPYMDRLEAEHDEALELLRRICERAGDGDPGQELFDIYTWSHVFLERKEGDKQGLGPPLAGITKCDGNFCELRESCYRYTAIPNPEYQMWMTAPAERPCPLFWPNERAKPSNEGE